MYEFNLNKKDLLFDDKDHKEIFLNIMEIVAKKIKEAIHRKFKSSVELNSIVGINTDKDVMDVILRSLNVNVDKGWPPNIKATFSDPLGHWYGGDMPDEILQKMEELMIESIEEWMNTNEFSDIISTELMGEDHD